MVIAVQLETVDDFIASVNLHELYRRRMVRGADLSQWHAQLEAWLQDGALLEAAEFLLEVLDVVETLEQFDAREPQPYWYLKLADVYEDAGEPGGAAAVLRRWLARWPAEREGHVEYRDQICTRLAWLGQKNHTM